MTGCVSKEDNNENESSLASEQLQATCANQLFSVPMNFVLAVSVAAIARNRVSEPVLAAWLILAFLINVSRLYVVVRQLRAPIPSAKAPLALRINGATMLLSGLHWAMVPAFMFDIRDAQAPYIIFIISGLTAGATVSAGTFSLGAIAFVFPIFATFIGHLLIQDPGENCLISIDGFLYLILLISSARRGEDALVKTLRLRLQATALAISLDREHTASKAAAARFFELANQDTLTGLANRAAFSSQMSAWFSRARREATSFHLFLLDLDHFKSINDTLGHSAGDEVLKEAARRVASTLAGDHVVARLGGDEFAVLLAHPAGEPTPGSADHDPVRGVADLILSRVSGTFRLGGQTVSIGVSVGIAQFPGDGLTPEELLAHADLALYAAKDGGRHRWRHFDGRLLADATMARDIEHDLPAALADGALQVFFQPQIALGDMRLAGLEALLRWNHPVHGWLAPPAVVSAARRIRQSEQLTGFVIDQACRQISRLNRDGCGDVLVAINVSPSELDHYALPALIERALAAHGIAPQQLEVEITEETFAASEGALATLAQLSAMGVRLAIDDFGAGCSSIAYLRSMRVDRIKIDRSFVTGFADRPGDRILVQAILGIGRSFGIEVLAEGVETIEDVLLLKALGCGAVQGYHFGRPMNHADITAWKAEHDRRMPTIVRHERHEPVADCAQTAATAA